MKSQRLRDRLTPARARDTAGFYVLVGLALAGLFLHALAAALRLLLRAKGIAP